MRRVTMGAGWWTRARREHKAVKRETTVKFWRCEKPLGHISRTEAEVIQYDRRLEIHREPVKKVVIYAMETLLGCSISFCCREVDAEGVIQNLKFPTPRIPRRCGKARMEIQD